MININQSIIYGLHRILIFLLVICCITLLGIHTVKGKEEPLNKTYITIAIERNDTLWCIAEKYRNTAYYSTFDYINEVKLINRLNNDTILAGDTLVIPIIRE